MKKFFILMGMSCLISSGIKATDFKTNNSFEEQSFFSGSYVQTKNYDDGQSIDLGYQNTGDIVSFDLHARTSINLGTSITESDLESYDLFSPVFDNYEFKKYDEGKYDSYVVDTDTMDGVAWGPKESPSNSTCKIRAYYHNINYHGNLVTLMYDFTGFLVGDSLLMTAAHGLYRDVTVDDYDDGVDNKYYPGKVEVYGAIGMADTWGSSYTYYATGEKVFIPSSYVINRSFADDWALIRLDRPLGRELSFRKLSVTPMDLCGDYRIIGYPSFNQFHVRMDVSAINYVVDSTRPMLEYHVSSLDGMSGSPFYSSLDESLNTYSGSDGHYYLGTRFTYGMHVCTNNERTISYAITFDSQIISLVDSLNTHYKKESDIIQFSQIPLNNQSQDEVVINIGGGYECVFSLQNTSLINGHLSLQPGSSFSIRFPFPLENFSFSINGGLYEPDLYAYCESFNSSNNREFTIESSEGLYSISLDGLYSLTVVNVGFYYNQVINIESVSFDIDWNFNPINYSAPQYIDNEEFVGNCVSYSISGLDRPNVGSVLPIRTNGSLLNNLTDFYPGMLISCLQRALALEQIEMKPIGKYEVCESGFYKIALVCDPYRYYHVIRQNAGGSWSHYFAGDGVSYFDSAENYILWPDDCRIFHAWGTNPQNETHFDLSSFIGFFAIGRLNNA